MAKKPDTPQTGDKQVKKQAGNRGSFKPGQSGNPKGRPRTIEDKELIELEKLEKEVNALEGAKHGRHGPEPAKVFRLVGLGEIAIARIVKKLAERSKSDVVKLRACELAAKVLRMIREDSQALQEVNIVLEGPDARVQVNVQAPAPTPEPPSYNHPTPAVPGQPITITK
jgi:hypothetical protein